MARKLNTYQFHYLCVTAFIPVALIKEAQSLSITPPGDNVVAGRPFTLLCRIKRVDGKPRHVEWSSSEIPFLYHTSSCESPIHLFDPTHGLSGGCERVGSEEVYSLTIKNVTIDMEGSEWRCYNEDTRKEVTLRVKVMVTSVALVNPPGTLSAGDKTIFTCTTSPSKPEACIRWYIHRQGTVREITTGQPFCYQLSTSVKPTTLTQTHTVTAADNGANVYCAAINRVTDTPVESAKDYTLNVQFGPDSVTLTPDTGLNGNRVSVTENNKVTFTCTSGESNPAANISLYNYNTPVSSISVDRQTTGPNKGYIVSGVYSVIPTRNQDGHVIKCEANIPGSQKSHASAELTLDVSYNADSMSMITGEGMGVGIVVGGIIVVLVVVLLWVIRRGRHISSSGMKYQLHLEMILYLRQETVTMKTWISLKLDIMKNFLRDNRQVHAMIH